MGARAEESREGAVDLQRDFRQREGRGVTRTKRPACGSGACHYRGIARRARQPQRSLEPLSELRDELAILDEMYREEGRRKTLVEGEQALREELDRLRARHTVIEKAPAEEEEVTLELEKKRSELEDAQGELEARRTEWVRDRQDADTKLRDLRKQYLELQEQRERVISLGADGACPTCSRKLGENLEKVVEHLTETAETLRVDGAYYRSRFEQLSEMPANVRELDERRRALTADTGALERKLARVQLAVHELTGLVRDMAAKERRIEQMRRDIAVIARGFDAARYDFVKSEIAKLLPLASVRRDWVLCSTESHSSSRSGGNTPQLSPMWNRCWERFA